MQILYVPHPILRQKAEKLNTITDEDLIVAKNMMSTLINAPGVGLSANQVGVLKQIVTINFEDVEKKKKTEYILFNPKIINFSKKTVVMEEGCLSLPEQYAEVERPEEITFEYINDKKKLIKKTVNGYEARILQHEIDHLFGKLFIDYLSSLKRNILIKKVKKILKQKK
tara:strand:+ start:22078 stop:22584 length:507 start_codon:yes stop_codon:yes gene_type:complete